MKVIHYGAKHYNPDKVLKIENRNFVKPSGGLWTSPIESKIGWKDWCHSENFRNCDDNNSFVLQIKSNCKILIINSLNDLINLPFYIHKIGNYQCRYINYELLSKKYEAIWLTENGLHETHLSHPVNLYGWDCESVLIINPYCVDEIKKPRSLRALSLDGFMKEK